MKIKKEEVIKAFEEMKMHQDAEDRIFGTLIDKLELHKEDNTEDRDHLHNDDNPHDDWIFDYLYNDDKPHNLLNYLEENKFLEE